jgi:cell division protein FtsL
MIGQRYAVGGRTAGRPARNRKTSLRDRLSARPSVAGRERLLQKLHESPLVQLMLAMSLCALALLLYLAQASQASVVQYNIEDLQAQQTRLRANNAILHASATSLQSLQRVDQAATSQLHMTKPELPNTIWVSPPPAQLPAVASVDSDTQAAEQRSTPLAWMSRFADFVKSSF